MLTPEELQKIRVGLSLLSQQWILRAWALLLSAFSLTAWLWFAGEQPLWPSMFCAFSLLAGFVSLFYSIRVGFDQGLLRALLDSEQGISSLSAMDKLLVALRLLPTLPEDRPLAARLQGCLGLFKKQALAAVVQLILVLCFLLVR